MAPPRPTVIQITFSHYCQKVTWALEHAGIDYDVVNVSLPKMRRAQEFNPGAATVPVLHTPDDWLITESHDILEWIHEQAPDAGLYPAAGAATGAGDVVREWERWADEDVGPVTRREAYRVAYHHPWRFDGPAWIKPILRVNRALILNVLKLYKVRRFDATDKDAVPAILAKVAAAVRVNPAGVLAGAGPSAADFAVAALLAPLAYTATARQLDANPDWVIVQAYIERVRQPRQHRVKTRRIKDADFARYAALHARGGAEQDLGVAV